MGIVGALLASLFPGPFPRPVFGAVGVLSGLSGCCRAVQGPAAVVLWVGGGFLRRSLVRTLGRELHTPSGQFRTGAADLKGFAPCRRPPSTGLRARN